MVPLGRWMRGGCFALALGAVILAGFATFNTDNELGTIGWLVVTTIFGLTGLLGHVPRIRVGENELLPYELGKIEGSRDATEAAKTAATTATEPTEVVEALQQYLNSVASSSPTLSRTPAERQALLNFMRGRTVPRFPEWHEEKAADDTAHGDA